MTLSGFEFHFAFQVNVAAQEKPQFDILVHGAYGEAKFRVFHNDLIRGLSLKQQGRDYFVDIAELFFRHVHTRTGSREQLTVFAVCKAAVITILMRDGAMDMPLITAITDIRSPGKTIALFLYKIPAMLITGGAGGTFDAAQGYFSTYIGLFTAEAVDAEVLSIKEESSARIIVREPMGPNFF